MAMRTHYSGLVTDALLGETVTLCGWVNRRRDHGGVIIVDLRDREGYVQVVCDPDRAEMFKVAEDVRNEFCLRVVGRVRARPAGTENTNLTSGKVEVLCHELEVLNPSVTPIACSKVLRIMPSNIVRISSSARNEVSMSICVNSGWRSARRSSSRKHLTIW